MGRCPPFAAEKLPAPARCILPVQSERKYRYSLQQALMGNHKTVKTSQQPCLGIVSTSLLV